MSTAVDVETIEALDFEYVPPCESRHHGTSHFHGGDAYALVKQTCPHCGQVVTGLRCKPYLDYALSGGELVCDMPGSTCGKAYAGGLDSVRILSYVGAQ